MIAWGVAALLLVTVLRLRRRLELVARAEHELRGALTAFALAHERSGGPALHAELERARAALGDLVAARHGRRAPVCPRRVELERLVRSAAGAWGAHVEWRAGAAETVADEGRLAQALGNLLANAREHGAGEVTVEARRTGTALTIDVTNPERGRGIAIATAAARDAGARLTLDRGAGEFRATLDVPVAG